MNFVDKEDSGQRRIPALSMMPRSSPPSLPDHVPDAVGHQVPDSVQLMALLASMDPLCDDPVVREVAASSNPTTAEQTGRPPKRISASVLWVV